MENKRILKIIAGLLFGAGIGICVGVATQNVLSSILIGLGLGLCMCVALNSNKNN